MMFGEPGGSYAITFSDDESDRGAMNNMDDDGGNWENFVLRFGKYKGTTLSNMITQGRTRGYLRYILGWNDIRPNTALNINKALAHYDKMKNDRVGMPAPLAPPVLTREYSHSRK